MLSRLKRAIRSVGFIYKARRGMLMAYRRWKHGLRHVDPTFYIQPGSKVSPDLVAGAYSYIGPNCRVCPRVELGRYVMLAPNVGIFGGDHRFDEPGVPIIFAGRPDMPKTVIEDDVWVGYNSTVIAGVKIERGAIIAAGAVVTKDVPAYEIWGGVPAKKIADRFPDAEARAAHDAMLAEREYRGEFCEPLAQSRDQEGQKK